MHVWNVFYRMWGTNGLSDKYRKMVLGENSKSAVNNLRKNCSKELEVSDVVYIGELDKELFA